MISFHRTSSVERTRRAERKCPSASMSGAECRMGLRIESESILCIDSWRTRVGVEEASFRPCVIIRPAGPASPPSEPPPPRRLEAG